MTDVVEQLLAVEKAAKKAEALAAVTRPRADGIGSPVAVPDVLAAVEAAEEFTRLALNLPFRAVREELEWAAVVERRMRAIAEGFDDIDVTGTEVARQIRDALSYRRPAVLCPDPAGGEG